MLKYSLKKALIILAVMIIGLAVYFFADKKENQAFACSDQDSKKQCWEKEMEDVLQKNGLSSAFDFMSDLYNIEPEFAKDCHSYTHLLGQYAYKVFSKNDKVDIGTKTAYCGYGFYHGFVEALTQDGRSLLQAKEFCAYADRQLAGHTNKTVTSCYHGIGHGTVDGGDPRAWGDEMSVIKPGLGICREISENDEIKYFCATGVFNSLAIALNFNQYNLKANGDPYDSCYNLKEDYFKRACYQEMNTHALHLAGGDLSKASQFVNMILEPKYAEPAIEQLAGAAIAYGNGDQIKYISVCQSSISRNYCFRGLVGGILEHGKLNSEYNEALSLCDNKNLDNKDKEICYSYLVSSARGLYPSDKVLEICNLIDPAYNKICF